LIAEVQRHVYFPVALPHRIGLPKLCYLYIEWTVARIEPRTFRLQSNQVNYKVPTELTDHKFLWCTWGFNNRLSKAFIRVIQIKWHVG